MDGFKTAAEMMREAAAGGDGADFEESLSQEDAPGRVIQITEDGGVSKEIVKAGKGWDNPERGDKVTVHYVGTLLDGEKFDSSRDRDDPFEFKLGEGAVIKGWDLGVATMKRGEVSKLTITSKYGYGDSGSPPKIPGGATLVFEVELLDWKSVKDIAGDGGVIKTVVTEGSGWSKPQAADEVCVWLSARVQGAAEPFYTSAEEGEEFELSKTHFCRAIATDVAPNHALPPSQCAAAATMKEKEEVKLIVKPEYGFGEEGRGAEVPPGSTLEIDMKMLGWKKVEKVTPDGLVMKKTLKDTGEWKKPNAGSQVTVTYTARVLPSGPVFDEKTAEAPLQFTTDEGQVIEGIEQAVMKMKEGEQALVTIAPQYAFGDKDSEQPLATVPAGSTLEYDITLISFIKAKDTWEMDTAEKLAAASAQKEKGNAAFKAGQYAKAVQRYNKAVEAIEIDEQFSVEEKKASRDVKKSCNLNIAAAQLKLGNPVEARKAADKVLEHDGSNLKALYRRAQAWMETKDFVEAEMDIKKGLVEDADSTDFKLLLRKFKVAQASAVKKERGLWAGMMKGLSVGKAGQAAEGGAAEAAAPAGENAAAVAGGDEAAAVEGEAMEEA